MTFQSPIFIKIVLGGPMGFLNKNHSIPKKKHQIYTTILVKARHFINNLPLKKYAQIYLTRLRIYNLYRDCLVTRLSSRSSFIDKHKYITNSNGYKLDLNVITSIVYTVLSALLPSYTQTTANFTMYFINVYTTIGFEPWASTMGPTMIRRSSKLRRTK